MFGFNTSYATGSARDYVEQLFGKSQGARASSQESTAWKPPPSWDAQTGTSAQDRALANIISIIWTMEHGDESGTKTSVTESGGYILDATGTDGADKIDMKAISAFNLSTGDGDDSLTIKAGSVAGLDTGAGKDTVNMAASYMSEIDGGEGDDTIQLTGDLADGVYGGEGNDTIKISAGTILNATGGAGDDTIYLEGERIFASGGTGDDTITVNNAGNKPAELSFARGDGKDTINSTGPLNIRFGNSDYFSDTSGSSNAALTPDELDISVGDNKLIVRSKTSSDTLTINFDPGALESKKPAYSFVMEKGDYVLKIG